MNFNLIVYIVVSIMMISGSFYLNFSNGKSTQAMILGIGFLLVSVIFGLRWFSSVFTAPTNDSMVWPPVINTCPDYLTLMKVNGTHVCVDTVGASQQQDILSKWTNQNQTDAKYIFNLSLDKVGAARVSAICDSCKAAKITWEGVWDGDVCLNAEPPRPV